MCTAIAYKGNDLLYGFNLDVDPAVWAFSIYKTKSVFALAVTVGSTKYLVHGVGSRGQFGNTPYMNGEPQPVPKGARRERIDLLSDRYIRGKYSFADVEEILRTKTVVNVPAATMHSLLGNGSGDLLIVEPGYGQRRVEERFAVLTNFPVLTELPDYSCPFYGRDRYDKATAALSAAASSGADFTVADALNVLRSTKQEGQWATRASFVWSRNENAVYYCTDGDFDSVKIHRFG